MGVNSMAVSLTTRDRVSLQSRAPLSVLCNVVEIRSDAFKLFKNCRRPHALPPLAPRLRPAAILRLLRQLPLQLECARAQRRLRAKKTFDDRDRKQ